MKEVSNKTLAILLIIAIVVSFGGSLLSLNKLGDIIGIPGISGFGTIGEVNVTISQQISINLTYPGINFGSGYITSGNDYAVLCSEDGVSTGWSAGSVPAGGIVIENIGNTDVNVSFYLAQNTSAFVGGSDPQMEWRVVNNESDSCTVAHGLRNNWTSIIDANYNTTICENLTSDNGKDSIDFHVNLSVPSNAQGTKGVLITFEASLPE